MEVKAPWRSMDTAPKDGTHILGLLDTALEGERRQVIHWREFKTEEYRPASIEGLFTKIVEKTGVWIISGRYLEGCTPIAWAPLPADFRPAGGAT